MNLLINTGHFPRQVNGQKTTQVRLLELNSHYETTSSVYRQFELTQNLVRDVLLKSPISQRLIDLSNTVKNIVRLVDEEGVQYESLSENQQILYVHKDYLRISDGDVSTDCICDLGSYFTRLRAHGVIQNVEFFNCVHKRENLIAVEF